MTKWNELMGRRKEEELVRRKRCSPYKQAVTLSDQWASTSAALTNCSLSHVRPHPLLLVLSPHHSYISNKIYHQHLVNRQPVDDVYCSQIARSSIEICHHSSHIVPSLCDQLVTQKSSTRLQLINSVSCRFLTLQLPAMAAKLRSFFIRDLLADAVSAPEIQGNHFEIFVGFYSYSMYLMAYLMS